MKPSFRMSPLKLFFVFWAFLRKKEGEWGRDRGRERERERERESQADSKLSTEPDMGLDLMHQEIMT